VGESASPRARCFRRPRLARPGTRSAAGETAEAEACCRARDRLAVARCRTRATCWRAALADSRSDRIAEALATLGDGRSRRPRSTCVRSAWRAISQALRAAAAWQEVAIAGVTGRSPTPARFAKANTFLTARDYRAPPRRWRAWPRRRKIPRSAPRPSSGAPGAVFMTGDADSALDAAARSCRAPPGHRRGARAQFLVGEALVARGRFEPAIAEYNRVPHALLPAQGRGERPVPRGALPRRAGPEGRRHRQLPGGGEWLPAGARGAARGLPRGRGAARARRLPRRGALLPDRARPLHALGSRQHGRVRRARATGAGRGLAVHARVVVARGRRHGPGGRRAAPDAAEAAAEPGRRGARGRC
jgi:hypothetical protein